VGIPAGIPTDARRDMIKELIAARLVAEFAAAEGTLKDIVTTGEQKGKTLRGAVLRNTGPGAGDGGPRADRGTPTSEQVQRALQALQRDAGLPVTGRFDDATAQLLQRLGLVPPQLAPPTTAPATTPATTPSTTPVTTAPAPATTPPAAAERKPVDAAAQQQTRGAVSQREQLLRARFDPGPRTTTSAAPSPPLPDSTPVDRALDPARLMASLVAAGFKGASPSQAVSSFQTATGLPPSGQLDRHTVDALATAGHISPEAAAAHAERSDATGAASGSTQTSKAASKDSKDSTSSRSSRADVSSASVNGSGAKKDVVARTAASSPEEAREQARLESLMAQAAATERGVQDHSGDLAALAGHGQVAGAGTGLTGSGASGGGADTGGDEASLMVDDGAAGDESSTGNSDAGDDDHDDADRGDAVAAHADDAAAHDDDGVIPDGYSLVQPLSVQVAAALETIARIDADDGPVCYVWDVTLYRPGVYADGQPAEAVWHLVVDSAHAFDPVWQRAVDAIASRLLYVEPDATPPGLDDLLGALRRARVR